MSPNQAGQLRLLPPLRDARHPVADYPRNRQEIIVHYPPQSGCVSHRSVKPNSATNTMKTSILNTLLFTFVFTFTAAATPPLLIETTITGPHGKKTLSAPAITVARGGQALIQVNGIECVVTPTLLDEGLVSWRADLSRRDGKDTDHLSVPQITTKLGVPAEIEVEQLSFAITATLAK